MEYLFYFIVFNITIYTIGLSWFIVGIIKNKKINFNKKNLNVSVIVCVKNGESSLPYILNDLHSQIYNSNIEFIIVDDNSNDKTKKIIQDFSSKDERFKYAHSSHGSEKLKYKKRALDAGIMLSKYDILLFTDVDCRVSENWASSMIDNFNNNIDYVIGYSDHTIGTAIPVYSTFYGAKCIEKHFTYDNNLKTSPDHWLSLDTEGFKQLVNELKVAQISKGTEARVEFDSEREAVKFARRSIVSKIKIPKGIKITQDMLNIKRPGMGVPPKYFDKIIGSIALNDIEDDVPIMWEDVDFRP